MLQDLFSQRFGTRCTKDKIMADVSDKSAKIQVTHLNIRQSVFFLVLKLILLDVFAAFLSIVYFSSVANKFMPAILSSTFLSYNLLFFVILAGIKIVLSINVVMGWINEYYEIWPDTLMHNSGFLFNREEKHPLSHVKSIKLEQGFFGKTFGFGTISLYDWYLEKDFHLYLIHNPLKYLHVIEGLVPKAEEEKKVFQEKATSGE